MESTFTKVLGIVALTAAFGACPAAGAADEARDGDAQRSCAAKTQHTYGFQCQGLTEMLPGLGLEPVTFVGTVTGDRAAVFRGYGSFNSSTFGATRQRVVGQALFHEHSCFGRIRYDIFVQLPGGGEAPLPPLDIDFTVVNGGGEILGTPTAAPGVTGAAVPRLSCRLVRVQGAD